MAEPLEQIRALTERLEWLETRSAYQERLLETLNTLVTQQQSTIDRLTQKVRELLSEQGSVEATRDEKPPHY